MYAPAQHREERPEVLAAAVRDIRLAALVAAGPDGLEAAHAPTVLKGEPGAWTLECHVARGNPIWRVAAPGRPALAIFQGPQAYVTPAWYPSKREHGKVVPTWNYVAVQARGILEAVEDGAWLARHLDELTAEAEAGRPEPWAVGDAPAEFIAALTRGIVGLRLRIERLEGSWKLIQHRPDGDRAGTAAGLSASPRPGDQAVAALMRQAEAARTARG